MSKKNHYEKEAFLNEETKKINDIEEKEVVEVKAPAPKIEDIQPVRTGMVIGGANLNVRKNPGKEIIKTIPNGSKVTIVSEKDDWYEISLPEKGFVMKKFIAI